MELEILPLAHVCDWTVYVAINSRSTTTTDLFMLDFFSLIIRQDVSQMFTVAEIFQCRGAEF